MTAVTLAMVVGSAALHSLWNIGLKSQKDSPTAAVVLAAFACCFALIAGFGNLSTALTPATLPYTIGAGLFAGGALAFIGFSFQGGSLGLSYWML